jgi:hypothetical protein
MNILLLSENFYSNVQEIFKTFSSMEFYDCIFGQELEHFNFIPQGMEQKVEEILKEKLEIQPDTGILRKPNSFVHFESFYQHCQWLCIVAIENTTIKIHERENIKTIFDVENLEEFLLNETNPKTWMTSKQINMKQNDIIFIRPWLWYSLEENKLVQLFLLNKILPQTS